MRSSSARRRARSPMTAPRRAYVCASARPSPLDAPVMKTRSALTARKMKGLLLRGAALARHDDQLVENRDDACDRLAHTRRCEVAPVNDERRRAFDHVGTSGENGLFDFTGHVARFERGRPTGAVDAVARSPGGGALRGIEMIVLYVVSAVNDLMQ